MAEAPNSIQLGPDGAQAMLLLAHGAGGPMDSPFMNLISEMLAERSIATVRFEFAYMARRRVDGKRRPAPKAETLVEEYRMAIIAARPQLTEGSRLLIGGKSMGGRVASLLLSGQGTGTDEASPIAGLVCLGYPFHPTSKPEQLRIAHLRALQTPALFVQGERDPFGSRLEVEAMELPATIQFHWAGDGDHDLGPRGSSGFTRKGNLAAAADAIAAFALR